MYTIYNRKHRKYWKYEGNKKQKSFNNSSLHMGKSVSMTLVSFYSLRAMKETQCALYYP